MAHQPSLDTRIANLDAAVDAKLRDELGQLLRTLRDSGNPIGVLLGLSRLSLVLMRLIYEKAGRTAPSDNLYDCLVVAGRGDPDRNTRGLAIVPDEIVSGLHTVRTLSNKAVHAVEKVSLSVRDAENALGLYLRAVEWWYHEAEQGPRLPAVEPPSSRSIKRRLFQRPLLWTIVAVCLAAGLLVFFAARDRLFPSSAPPPSDLPDWSDKLPAAPVLRLLALGSPPQPPSGFARPRFRLDLLGRRRGQAFRPLDDGDPLASAVDDYLLVVRPQTAGHLYVFQLDSRGTLAWLFPTNSTSRYSSGTNPLDAAQRTQIPAEKRQRALFLDENTGLEQVFAVFSATRWTELEECLEKAGGVKVPGDGLQLGQLDLVRGVETSRGIGGERPIDAGGRQSIDAHLKGGKVRLNLVAPEDRAAGWFFIVSRWFRHVE